MSTKWLGSSKLAECLHGKRGVLGLIPGRSYPVTFGVSVLVHGWGEFLKSEVKCFGHVVSKEGLKTYPENLDALKSWLIPEVERPAPISWFY